MSVYNDESHLNQCVESILNQTFKDFEFIIVNDGSTDGSLNIIKSYNDPKIRLINNETNIGLTKSLNKAIKSALGEYIARQDSDDISSPKRLEKQFNYMETHQDVMLLGSSFYIIDDNNQILNRYIPLKKPKFKDILKTNQFSHGSIMFRKKIVEELGYYNEFFRYAQDYELWLRIMRTYEARNLKDFLYNSREHPGKIGFTKIEQSLLYRLFAVKITKNEINPQDIETVQSKGIFSLYSFLNPKEKSFIKKNIGKVSQYKEYTNSQLNDGVQNKHSISFLKTSLINHYLNFHNFVRYLKNLCN
jgi:glycosyltransferase involved in cell wall biosynthesis